MNQQQPNSKDIENNIIGALLLNPNEIVKVDISAEDFYWDYNRTIFETIQKLHAENKSIDIVTVATANKSIKQVDLLAMLNDTVTSMHLETHCQELKRLAIRRLAIRTAEWLATKAFDNRSNMDKVISEVMTKLTNLAV